MANCKNVNETTVTREKQLELAFGAVLLCASQGIMMKGQIKKPLYQYSDDESDSDDSVLAITKLGLRLATDDYSSDSPRDSQAKRNKPNPVILTKQTQDQILETARHIITSRLVSEINEAKSFSLLSEKMLKDDDACRIPLFVRFVDKNLKIREDLLQYVPRGTRYPEETWGQTICKNILRVMAEIGVNMQFCRGLNFDSTGISSGMLEFGFVITMIIVANCLKLTNDLTDELQKVCYDSASIRDKVLELLTKLDELKSNVKEHHIAWYEEAVHLATKIEIEPKKNRLFDPETKPDPNSNESICECYLKELTLPFLDHMKAQIQIRFSEACLDALDGLAMIPSNVRRNTKIWKTAASRFLRRYKCDQPESDANLDTALELWEKLWKDEHQPPDTALKLLSSHKMEVSKQIFPAFKIYASMPVIPSESEIPRLMPIIHQDLCLYSMTDKYLNALALMSIRGHQLKTEDVIESFKMKYTLPVVEDSA